MAGFFIFCLRISGSYLNTTVSSESEFLHCQWKWNGKNFSKFLLFISPKYLLDLWPGGKAVVLISRFGSDRWDLGHRFSETCL